MTVPAAVDATTPLPTTIHDVPGWFFWADQHLFDLLLTDPPAPGHLVELGAYLGKSAVLVGRHQRAGERFIVCDLFGADADAADNRAENARSYATLTRQGFERNYLAFHATLPEVLQAPSATITRHLPPASVRFLHVDASHLYEHVAVDVRSAASLLRPDGVVVFDDWRAEHTPGVAAAIWQAWATLGLRPFASTPHKLYATFGDPTPPRARIAQWLATEPKGFRSAEDRIGPDLLLRVKHVKEPPPGGRVRAC